MPNAKVRVRFAPSPTGPLHVGGARTALFNWLFAKNQGGDFLLRIEDTDQTRYDAHSEEQLKNDLLWLGLEWDEGPGKEGACGPYKQSENLAAYNAIAEELVNKTQAYYCFCTPERLEEVKARQKAEKKSITGYDRHCRHLSSEAVLEKLKTEKSYVIRLKVPLEGETVFRDELRGDITVKNENLDDLVLFKSNGFPAYHLANIVDDRRMEITHVMRGEEWIPSTPKHVLIHKALGYPLPKYIHLPVILAEGGKKLSKRQGATSVTDYREKGFLPEALLNFLALLGWNPGGDLELMDTPRLISAFGIDNISPKSCFFDDKKLEWMNGQYIQGKSAPAIRPLLNPLFANHGIDLEKYPEEFVHKFIDLLKERCKFVPDFYNIGFYFFSDPDQYDPKAVKKRFKADTPDILTDIAKILPEPENFQVETIEKAYQKYAESRGWPHAGELIHPTRLAVSGLAGGPGLYDIMEMVGKEAVVRRIEKAKAFIQALN